MQTITKWNKVQLPPDLVIPAKSERRNVKTIKKDPVIRWYFLFTNTMLLKRILILMLDWGLVALVYYGIGMSMTQLGGNIFINFVLASVGEILGYVFNIAVANYWGRKPTVVVGYT